MAESLRPWPADQVERRPLAAIIPYQRNARIHSDDQVEKIAASMLHWGVTAPVLVDEHGVLIYGHGRRRAAELLVTRGHARFSTLPCSIARGWSEDDKRAYRLADNQLTELSEWDMPMLKGEVAGLSSAGFEMNLLGFDDALINPQEPGAPDAIPLPAQAVTRLGDCWWLGPHRILCADATRRESWEELYDDGRARAAMVFTDPPYGVSYESPAGVSIEGDRKRRDELYAMLVKALQLALEHSAPDAGFYIWHASSTRNDFANAMTAAGLIERQYIIWVKPSLTLGHADYAWAHEPCFYASRPDRRPAFYADRTATTVWRVERREASQVAAAIGSGLVIVDGAGHELYVTGKPPKAKRVRQVRLTARQPLVQLAGDAVAESTIWEVAREASYQHPTQKPVELARRAIENSSRRGEIVGDAFLGSGTTLIAAELTGRACYATEITPAYCDVTIRRWQELTGTAAMLATGGDGRTFEELQLERAKENAPAGTGALLEQSEDQTAI